MILRLGLWPSRNAGKATDDMIDFSDLGGRLMISRLLSPRRTRSSRHARPQMPSRNEVLARRERGERLLDESVELLAQQRLNQPGLGVSIWLPHPRRDPF